MLSEPPDDPRTFAVRSRLQVSGELLTSGPDATTTRLKLGVDGRFSLLERRLPPGGPGAEAFRSLRYYQLAEADIDVSGHRTVNRLPDRVRKIVAEGRRSGVEPWSPDDRLTGDAVDLLRSPGDSLSLLALLPDSPSEVEAGATWQPADWVLPMLTGIEAVTTSRLTCRLDRVDAQFAMITVDGSIDGAIHGAPTKITVQGQIAWDLSARHVRQAKLTQTEERSVGAVSPDMKVTATAFVDRQVSGVQGPLTDSVRDTVPISPEPDLMTLWLDTPWRLRLAHSRDWHVFHQTADVAVLRLVRDGSLIAQCNLSAVPSVAPGTHTSTEQFQADMQTALGSQLQRITRVEPVDTGDGRWTVRIVGEGASRGLAMHWIYYLTAAPDGRQAALAFPVESRLLEQLAGHDADIVRSLQFLPPPARAAASQP